MSYQPPYLQQLANSCIEAAQTLIKLSDKSIRLQPKISGKFEGKIDAAAEKALDEGCSKVLKELK